MTYRNTLSTTCPQTERLQTENTLFSEDVTDGTYPLHARCPFPIFLITALVPFLFLLTGCHPKITLPNVINESASLSEIEQAVNRNSSKIQSLRAENATLGAANVAGWANCKIAYARPNKVRVVGTATMMGRIIDIGNNGDVFWFWNKFSEPQQLSWCRLSETQNPTVAQYIPIDPTWLPEALGIVEFQPGQQIQGPIAQDDHTLLLVTRRTDKGAVYTKYTYVEPKTAAVKRQDIQDAAGNVLVSVVCNEFQYDQANGVVLPKKLTLTAPMQKLSFHLDLGTPVVNVADTTASQTYQMPRPEDLGNVPMVDVAALKNIPNAVPTTGTVPNMPPTTMTVPGTTYKTMTVTQDAKRNPTILGQSASTVAPPVTPSGPVVAPAAETTPLKPKFRDPPITVGNPAGSVTRTVLPPLPQSSYTKPKPVPTVTPPVNSPAPVTPAPVTPAPVTPTPATPPPATVVQPAPAAQIKPPQPAVTTVPAANPATSPVVPTTVIVPPAERPPVAVASGAPVSLLPPSSTMTSTHFRTVIIP